MSESVASENNVKGPGFVSLPPEHVLRAGVDWVYASSPSTVGEWQDVVGLAGETVEYAASVQPGGWRYRHACCRVEDLPENLVPVRQDTESEQVSSTEPQPGQWWVFEGSPPFEVLRYVGRGMNGTYVFECGHFVFKSFASLDCMRHEPRCTGFDWKPTEQKESSDAKFERFAFAGLQLRKKIEELRAECSAKDSTIESLQVQTESEQRWIAELQETIRHQAENLERINGLVQSGNDRCALLTKIVSDKDQEIRDLREQISALQSPVSPEPNAEEHEGWEVQDRVPSRTGVDEWRVCLKSGDISDWSETITMNVMHGYATEDGHFEVRCRRKDLPPLEHSTNPTAETEQPKTQAIEIVRFMLQDKATSGVWYVAEGSSQYVEGIRSAGIYRLRELSRTTVEIPAE